MIYFSDFDAAPASGTAVAAVQAFTAPSGGGSFNVSDSGFFAGATPTAAFLVGGLHNTANDPSPTDGMNMGFGSVIGSTRRWAWSRSNDNVGSTDVSRKTDTTTMYFNNPLRNITPTTQADGLGFTQNNVAFSQRSGAMMFGSAVSNAATGTIALGTGTSAISVTTGFQPDLVILFGTCDNFGGSLSSFMTLMLGFTTSDGTQRSVCWGENNAVAAGGTPFQSISNLYGGMQVNGIDGTLTYGLTVGGFSSTAFTVTPTASTGSDGVGYLALKFSGATPKIVDFTTPTSTGVHSTITGAGITPTAAIIVGTALESLNTYGGSSSDLHSGLNVSLLTAANQATVSGRIDSGADPTDTSTDVLDGVALQIASGASAAAVKATLSGFVSGGVNLNYSTVAGTGKKGFALLVG